MKEEKKNGRIKKLISFINKGVVFLFMKDKDIIFKGATRKMKV